VVEVRGCFWHSHPDPHCRKATVPATRAEWWQTKLLATVERDRRNEQALSMAGWMLLVLWECELSDTRLIEHRLRAFLGGQIKSPNQA